MKISVKLVLYLLVFSILHFGYDLTHLSILKPFCGVNESVFQHLKMAFWAYLIASAMEYAGVKKKLKEKACFWYSRILATVIVPWFTFLIWYLVPAIFGKIHSLVLDILWAVISSLLGGISAILVEKTAEKYRFDMTLRIAIISLLVISAFLYIRFTYFLPWIDMFVDPKTL